MSDRKYASGYFWGWRGFQIARPTAKGETWRLCSPIARQVVGHLDRSEIMSIVPGEPATCEIAKENEEMIAVLNDMLADIASLMYDKTVQDEIEKQFKLFLPWDYDLAMSHTAAPDAKCTCGFYTYNALEHLLREYRISQFDAIGICKVYGKTQRYEHGYRSEFLEPAKIFISSESLRPNVRMSEKRRKNIFDEAVGDIEEFYQCEVQVVDPPWDADVLDAYLDPSIYVPAVEMPAQEIIKEIRDGQAG